LVDGWGAALGLGAIIAFGTERYPEKVARRLRAINIICWLAAILIAQFAVRRLLDPATFNQGLIAVAISLCLACLPLLHRVNSAAALFALIVLVYLDTLRVVWSAGTGGGYWLAYYCAIALAVLILGVERYILAGLLSLVALVLVVVLHIWVPHDAGELTPEQLHAAFMTNAVFYAILLFAVVFYAAWQIESAERTAERERERSDALLANILPAGIAERLRRAPDTVIADSHDEASVLFADMAGFTARAGAMSPEELVRFLNRIFSEFDRLVERHGLEKIKTTGDAYMVVAGVPTARADHAEALAALALDMRDAALGFEGGVPIRIGIACGPVVAGVVGSRKFFYDVWGDTVNVAARMETTGEPGRIQVSREAFARLDRAFVLAPRGTVEVKGKGLMDTWYLIQRRLPGAV
jgi:adenylate cyclase